MYHQYFGLSEPAFSIAVNPRYLYMSDQHKEALAHLLYGVGGGGFVLLTGEVGTGKTTIIRSLLEQLPENTDIAMVFNPMAEVPEMLEVICDELHVDYDRNRTSVKALTDALYQYLLDNHRRGRNTVLLIDEAQLLSPEALEQIRLLTNLETNTQKLLQIILVGQPELNRLLSQPRLRQLAQRITARFHLNPLTLAETRAYIAHRLQVAGLTGDRNPFPPAIVRKIHKFSGGIPRRINILCERALVGLYGHNKHKVDSSIFRLAKKEVVGSLREPGARRTPPGWVLVLVPALLLIILAAVLWPQSQREPASVPQAPVADIAAEPQVAPEADVAPAVKAYVIQRLPVAQTLLLREFGLPENNAGCWQGRGSDLQCETERLDTWESLTQLNRPVVLTLTTEERFTAYTVLVALAGNRAQVLDESGERIEVPLKELGPQWTGRVVYAWHRPPGYFGPIGEGDRGPAVNWLASQFVTIDGQNSPLTDDRYNRALAERVKIFQRRAGLEVDGILGQKTILRLNEMLGLDPTLQWQEQP
ncbi:ExeA family protein [Gilvimarinus algae]|uniref:AAA family ATPase n=1 Tax=Gilvimarinus algae TaxID=3058037 RepID=A0ABT8TKJ5_9GAMM|nr:ExeA family protein [Gilvimarinus sp. SDUM040014]MDO3384115.1 AAA family ATPase [Gilvimarinus sp. SDUM040014]